MGGESCPKIHGADSVVSWFGEWPSFHDAEILEIHLDRERASWLKLHACLLTTETYQKDGKQYFRTERHAAVTFKFAEIVDVGLADFSGQNVIFGLTIERKEESYRLTLHPCYGLNGYIEARQLSVEVSPNQ
jgi:immunity protein 50 of polymorphic toxin system